MRNQALGELACGNGVTWMSLLFLASDHVCRQLGIEKELLSFKSYYLLRHVLFGMVILVV